MTFPGSISHKTVILGLKLKPSDASPVYFPLSIPWTTALFLDLAIVYPFSIPTSSYDNLGTIWRCYFAQYWEDDSNTSCYTDIPEMSLFLYADELPLHANCPLASLLQKLILLKLMR